MNPSSAPYLKVNKQGIYEIRWTEKVEGKSRSMRKSTGTADLIAAQVEFGKWMRGDEITSSTLTVSEALDIYLTGHVGGDSVVIAKSRQFICADHIRTFMGSATVSTELGDLIAKYKFHRLLKVTGPTIRRELAMLRAALHFCARETKKILVTEIPHISLPLSSVPKNVWLDERNSELFLQIAAEVGTPRASLFCNIALETGSRKQVIIGSKWAKYSPLSKTIDFSQQGVRQRWKRSGIVPVSDRLKQVLDDAFLKRESDYILGHTGRIEREFQAVVDAFIIRAEWSGGNITPHTLRHTWATLAARAGVDLWQIAGVMHDSLTTVTKNYAHHCPDHLRNAVNFRQKRLENSAA